MKYRTTWLICLFIVAMCGSTAAELDTLEKLRTPDWDVWLGDGGYDLALMGDKAAPFLVQVLADENEHARWHAHYFLDRFYADTHVLSALTELFLTNEDSLICGNAASLIASVDAEYARQLMVQFLNDVERQDIAQNMLIHLGDERVIPRLVKRFEDPKIDQNIRWYIASILADFKQKSVVPALLKKYDALKYQWQEKEKVAEKLANIGDVRALPVLLNYLIKHSNLSIKIINAFSQSDPSIVQPLLEKLEQLKSNKSSYMRWAIFDILGNQTDPAFIPVYEKVILETDDSNLQAAMARALGNMGEKGFESLLKIVRQKPNSMALRVLATYNSSAAIDAVTSLALDESFTLRTEAIQALLQYGSSWKAEIFEHMLLLLADTDLEVRLLTIDLIRRMNLTVMAPALKKLTEEAKGSTQNAAHMVYDILHDKPQLELGIELSKERYDYGQPISLTYRITNISDHPIKIALYKTLKSTFLKLEIQQPDGTFAKYIGPIAKLAPLTLNDFQTLQPDDEITGTILFTKYYKLRQPGRYTVQLRVSQRKGGLILPSTFPTFDRRIPLNLQIKPSFFAWPYTLISPKMHFNIEPPPVDKFNQMIASIDPELITEENSREIANTCGLLGELRKPEAIPTLKKLALIKDEDLDHSRQMVRTAAGDALLKFSDPDLVPTWIEMLNIGYQTIHDCIEALGTSGDARAIEPLRQIAFCPGNYGLPEKAALALQQLGDNSGVEWFKKVAYRKLRHWQKDKREKGVWILNSLYPRKERITTRLHNLRNPRFYAKNYDLFLNWAIIREKAAMLSGLKELLKHENLIIQRAAAYELAYRGDRSGVHYIKKDLYANDSSTRMHARDTLVKLQSE